MAVLLYLTNIMGRIQIGGTINSTDNSGGKMIKIANITGFLNPQSMQKFE